MYLSRLILNPRSRRVQKEIANPYEMHRSIMHAFPDDLKSDRERVLFRLESQRRTGNLTLLVQSWMLPDWSWLAEPGARGYLLPVGEPNPAIKSFELALAPSQTLAFRLRANPTVKRDGKRHGLFRVEEQREWLTRKAERGGFRVLSAQIANTSDAEGWIRHSEQRHKLKLFAVRFDGFLRVNEPEQLRETVRHGIGPGKGLGFGLLSLARPSL
jgi:CRISPR system Cascade subunit CasE